MSGRIAARYISRRFSSGGKVFRQMEKAAENIYIKKMEKEKLEKLARQGPKPAQATVLGAKATATERKPSGPDLSTPKVSFDKYHRVHAYASIAGYLTGAGVMEWLYKNNYSTLAVLLTGAALISRFNKHNK